MGETNFTSTFVDGARDLLGVALIIGIARGITVVMTNGLITDTVLNAAEQAVAGLGGAVFITLMYVLFLPLSFLIPSSSGPGHRGHADHGAPGQLRRRPRVPGGDRLPDRQRADQSGHPDLGGRDGWAGDRARRLRHLAALRLAHLVCSASCPSSS